MKLIFTSIILFVTLTAAAQDLYSVSPYQDSIWAIDTTTMIAVMPGVGLTTASGGTVTGCNGLALRPGCGGDLYVVAKVSGVTGRVLGIVDPITGVIAEVGNMGDNVAGICFGSQNHMYAVTGDGATTPESLFEVDIATGAMTLMTAYGAGSDGENIGFCSDNGKIYHWSGRDTDPAMESTDTLTGITTTITRTGYNYDEVMGSVYLGEGMFMLANLDQEFILVDTTGFAVLSPFTTAPNYFKGLAFASAAPTYTLATSDSTTFCPGDSALFTVTSGSSYEWFLNGSSIAGATNQSYAVSQAGTLSAEVTDSLGCTFSSDTVTISTLNLPIVGITPGDSSICLGDSIALTGSSGGSSQWYMDGNMIPGADSNVYVVTVEGLYNMTKTNQNGCTDSSSVGTYITVNNLPNVSLTPSGDTTYCVGDSVLLTGSTGGASQWYLNGVAIPGATQNTFYASTDGYYNMVKTNSNGCADSSAVGISVVEDPCDAGLNDLNPFFGSVQFYPVPVNEQLNISFSDAELGSVTFAVYTMDGSRVYRANREITAPDSTITLDLTDLSNGAYIVEIQHSELRLRHKLIKQ